MGPFIQALGSQAKKREEQSYSSLFPISSSGSEAGARALLFAWVQIFLLLDHVVTTQYLHLHVNAPLVPVPESILQSR